MLDTIRALLHRRREYKAVESLTDRDLADLGMTRAQVMHFLHMPADAPDRVVAMARIFGLSEGEIKRNHSEWLDLVETCSNCPDRASCSLLLAKGELANPRDAHFCPNRQSFAFHWQAA